jgi:iron complex outermembrane receptor protein
VLRSVPGFYTESSLTETYLGVRGFLQPGDYNARVLLLIDGHRVNDNLKNMATLGADFPLDLSLIDHIEVLRGGGSSLYGTDAELAVINVLTRHPDVKPTIAISSEADSFLGRKLEIGSSFRTGRASGLLDGSLYRENGPAWFELPADPTNGTSANSIHVADGERYDHLFGTFRRGSFGMQGLFSSRDKLVPGAPVLDTAAGAANRESTQRGYLDATYNAELGNSGRLDLRAYYDHAGLHTSNAMVSSGGPSATGPDYKISTGKADWLGFESVYAQHIGRQRVVAGAQSEYDLNLSQTIQRLSQGSAQSHSLSNWLAAVFGEAELNLGTRLSLSLGGREDWTGQHQSSFSPRIAGMYFPTRDASLKYVFAKAFRAPDAAAQFCPDILCSSSAQTTLQPEHMRSDTLTYSQRISSHLNWTATGFQNKSANLINQIPSGTGPNPGFTNKSADRSSGLELEASAVFESAWSARASYAFNRSVNLSTGNRLDSSPSHLAKFNGSAPLFSGNSIALELQYNSSETSDLDHHISPLFQTNATFLSRSFWGGMRFSASCFDCLDRSIALLPEPDPTMPLPPGTARTWRFRIDYRHHAGRRWSSQ